MNRTARTLTAALAASALVLAACGGDDDAADTTVSTVAPETTEAETTTTEAETTTTAAPETTDAPATTEAPETTTTEAPAPDGPTIVDVATEAGDFTLLLTAVEAAGLTETLSTRDVTVLAPTDEAIQALGDEALAALLPDTEALTALLMNHVLPLPQTAEQIGLFNNVLAMGGASWPITIDGDMLMIGDATVIAADVEASNGYIQVIDTVLLPAPTEG